MIFHSDLGSQYTSNEYEKILLENGVRHSYATFKEAKKAIFEFIESWYNNVRIHSSLNYKTPDEKYNEYLRNIA